MCTHRSLLKLFFVLPPRDWGEIDELLKGNKARRYGSVSTIKHTPLLGLIRRTKHNNGRQSAFTRRTLHLLFLYSYLSAETTHSVLLQTSFSNPQLKSMVLPQLLFCPAVIARGWMSHHNRFLLFFLISIQRSFASDCRFVSLLAIGIIPRSLRRRAICPITVTCLLPLILNSNATYLSTALHVTHPLHHPNESRHWTLQGGLLSTPFVASA